MALASETGPLGSEAAYSSEYNSSLISIYVVREGDTLSGIAKMFGVSKNTILWANNIPAGGKIVPGQRLEIFPVNGLKVTVKKNDTLASLAKKHKGDVQEIANYNGIALSAGLTIGEEIFIPDGVLERVAVAPAATASRSGAVGSLSSAWAGPSLPGYFIRPTAGILTQGLHPHNGVDIASKSGTPIRAAASGEVIIVRSPALYNGGYGGMVVIQHPNGVQTLYAHTSKNLVSPGQYVSQGDVIANVGNTGKSTGPHVHFEVRGAQNPFAY